MLHRRIGGSRRRAEILLNVGRSNWMPFVVTLSCRARRRAERIVCAEDAPALVESACSDAVNLSSVVSSVPLLPRVP